MQLPPPNVSSALCQALDGGFEMFSLLKQEGSSEYKKNRLEYVVDIAATSWGELTRLVVCSKLGVEQLPERSRCFLATGSPD